MDIYSYHEGEEILERGEAPLLPTLPLPLLREGGQGDRLLNDLMLTLYGGGNGIRTHDPDFSG